MHTSLRGPENKNAVYICGLEDNNTIRVKGQDLIINGNIGKNTTIFLENGHLTVKGNIGIKCTINVLSLHTSSFFSSSNKINITGDIADQVQINAHHINADLLINGSVGSNCSFKIGSGTITTGDIAKNTSLTLQKGNINCHHVAEHATITTHDGAIKVLSSAKTAILDSPLGNVYVNGKIGRNHSLFPDEISSNYP